MEEVVSNIIGEVNLALFKFIFLWLTAIKVKSKLSLVRSIDFSPDHS